MTFFKHLTRIFIVVSIVLVGCRPADKRAEVLDPLTYLDAPDTVPAPQWQRISEAARKTRQKHNFIKFGKVISEDKWEPAIRELRPIRVVTEPGGNVIIVLREFVDTEEGLYARLPRSSHYPLQREYEILDGVYTPEPAQGIRYDDIWRYLKKKENPTEISDLVSQIGTATLSRAGQETRSKYAKGSNTPVKNIRSEFWADEIQRLTPVGVYQHRGNIVVVLCESNDVEEGVYIYSWISSYFPRNGDDGFTFKHLEHSVFKYTRDLKSDASDPKSTFG